MTTDRRAPDRRARLRADVVVVGGGAVGLAVTRALALALKPSGRAPLLLERERAWGAHSSSRSSEVIHAGLYYAPGSLKEELCAPGRRALYSFLEERGLPHARLGKLVVAPSGGAEEAGRLESLAARAAASGVEGLSLLSPRESAALEPHILARGGALLSRETGILCARSYMRALRREAEEEGAQLALGAPVERVARAGGALEVWVGGADPCVVRCDAVVNAAGLWAHELAARVEGGAPPPPVRFARGRYMSLSAPAPARRLIYPLPEPGGLGVHLTLDLAGRARFGPDVEWLPSLADAPGGLYAAHPHAEEFERAVRAYWPGLPAGALSPSYAGVRVKVARGGGALEEGGESDFCVWGPPAHGVEGVVHLLGVESPGLTSSLALAERALKELL